MRSLLEAIVFSGGCSNASIRLPILATDYFDAPPECVVRMSATMNRVLKTVLPRSSFLFPPPLRDTYRSPRRPQLHLPRIRVGARAIVPLHFP